MASTPPDSSISKSANEISGVLTIQGERNAGAYGAYWKVTITPEVGPPIEGTLSEKVWLKAGLPASADAVALRATARRNANGRWNVIDIDSGIREFRDIPAMLMGLYSDASEAPASKELSGDRLGVQVSANSLFRFRLCPTGSPPYETAIAARALQKFGIQRLPVNYVLVSDWQRETSGWKLKDISQDTLLGFFKKMVNGIAEAAGRCSIAWRFDEPADLVSVEFDTDIPGVAVACAINAESLRHAGVRAVSAGEPVKALLSLREGRWRLAELIEPRPDRHAVGSGEIIYAVRTHFAYQEENRFGELEDWLEVDDERAAIEIASLSHDRLIEINEDALSPGATIVCDLKRGKNRWYASRVHRVTD